MEDSLRLQHSLQNCLFDNSGMVPSLLDFMWTLYKDSSFWCISALQYVCRYTRVSSVFSEKWQPSLISRTSLTICCLRLQWPLISIGFSYSVECIMQVLDLIWFKFQSVQDSKVTVEFEIPRIVSCPQIGFFLLDHRLIHCLHKRNFGKNSTKDMTKLLPPAYSSKAY